ncbi:hypothetical protein GCM10023093_23370 [Nemorincola caseinilytica]|uniref:Large ribosomal subunit protein bL12 C-terminal domain-containing protein n=1 Tax=Nemorincola caseinilytica TaxID=2054315 RepID=A0ABP8NLQ3_9BACT
MTDRITLAGQANGETLYNVILKKVSGNNKLEVIKVLKEFTTMSLIEASDAVDRAPCHILHDATLEKAEELAGQLRATGAEAEVVAARSLT